MRQNRFILEMLNVILEFVSLVTFMIERKKIFKLFIVDGKQLLLTSIKLNLVASCKTKVFISDVLLQIIVHKCLK